MILGRQTMQNGKRATTHKAKRLQKKRKILKRFLAAEMEAAAAAEDHMEMRRLNQVVSGL